MEYLLIIAAVVFVLRLPAVKGFFGELAINILLSLLDKNEYALYKDIYVAREDGTTSQIDHIVVSKYGIFVIETKNYSGWIFGSESSKNWTQTIYKNKTKFLNPIIQNKGHIKTLKNYLEFNNNDYFFSIIVFTTNATFKKITTETPVIYSLKITEEIKKHENPVINENELSTIKSKLDLIKSADFKKRIKHVEDIKSKYSSS